MEKAIYENLWFSVTRCFGAHEEPLIELLIEDEFIALNKDNVQELIGALSGWLEEVKK